LPCFPWSSSQCFGHLTLLVHDGRNQVAKPLAVGAGQAGIAMIEHLRHVGVPHLVLERELVAERWDSLVCNGPA